MILISFSLEYREISESSVTLKTIADCNCSFKTSFITYTVIKTHLTDHQYAITVHPMRLTTRCNSPIVVKSFHIPGKS